MPVPVPILKLQNLTEAAAQECAVAFEMLDSDGDGKLSKRDAVKWLRCLGFCCSDKELAAMIAGVPVEGGGLQYGDLCNVVDACADRRGVPDVAVEHALRVLLPAFNDETVPREVFEEAIMTQGDCFSAEEFEDLMGMCNATNRSTLRVKDLVRGIRTSIGVPGQ
mmetsp:Transcript_29112/g.64098  ORF Transcript_29112/g.64098 Transcript_29112/m.64098 type:complete len:165 (+) Transcript_29112:31-525(+)